MAVDLSTTWMGLELDGPIVAGASPLTDNLESVQRLVDAGASAIVTQSLFEEQLTDDQMAFFTHTEGVAETHGEALDYFPAYDDVALGPDAYLKHIETLKKAVDVPVIASLNGITPGGWVRYAKYLVEAGADALELNVYYVASEPTESPEEVESRYLEILRGVRAAVDVPLAMKIGPYFSSTGHFASRLAEAGANGLVVFNRFFQPDLDIEELEVKPALHLSHPSELLLRLRAVAAMYGRVDLDFAITGGVHDVEDVIKGLMVGSNTVQMVSALLKKGPEHLKAVREGLVTWLEAHEYESVEQMIGSMSLARVPDPAAFSRANYRKILGTFHKY